MSEFGRFEHENPNIVQRLVEAVQYTADIEEVEHIIATMNGRKDPLGFSVVDESYPAPSLDVILPNNGQEQRVFIHETFTSPDQTEGEAILDDANLKYFPELARTDHFTFRTLPNATRSLRAHSVTKPTTRLLSQVFLKPTLTKLYQAHAVVPSAETMKNLVYAENVSRVKGSDVVEVGVRFLPPYEFQYVDTDGFALAALKSVQGYGQEVVNQLRQDLDI